MRNALPALVLVVCAAAHAQTPPGQAPSSLTLPRPPTAPQVVRPTAPLAPGADAAAASRVALMRTAQDARDDLRSVLQNASGAGRPLARATSNPCERPGRGAALSCIDGIKRNLSRAGLPQAEGFRLDQELSLLRRALLDAQSAGPDKRRAARLAEASERAQRIDAILARLAEPRPAPALPLDSLMPSLGD